MHLQLKKISLNIPYRNIIILRLTTCIQAFEFIMSVAIRLYINKTLIQERRYFLFLIFKTIDIVDSPHFGYVCEYIHKDELIKHI